MALNGDIIEPNELVAWINQETDFNWYVYDTKFPEGWGFRVLEIDTDNHITGFMSRAEVSQFLQGFLHATRLSDKTSK